MKWLAATAALSTVGLTLFGATGSLQAKTLPTVRRDSTATSSQPSITLSPDAGLPGTVVTVRGYIPSMKNESVKTLDQNSIGNIAFGGFTDGLEYAASSSTWSASDPGHFEARFTVPKTAWLTPTDTHALVNGSYSVAINCFTVGQAQAGCDLGPNQASATFTLTGAPQKPAPKAYLHLSLDRAKPGDTVHVTGWAPLTEIIGVPFPYNFTWSQNGNTSSPVSGTLSQSLSGQLSGSFKVPAANARAGLAHVGLQYLFERSNVSVSLAETPIHVLAPLTWAQLAIPSAVASESNSEPIGRSGDLVALPSQTTGTFLASRNGGRSWRIVNVSAINQLAEKMGYPTDWTTEKSPEVSTVLVDARDPSSFFITTAAISKKYGSAPPIFYTPYYSINSGASWRAVPVPRGFTQGDFGGFLTSNGRIEATWVKNSATAIEVTDNGGVSWHMGALLPLYNGLPLQFGAFPDQYPGMGVGIQQPVASEIHDHWATSTTVDATAAGAPASQLDRLLDGTLLINPMSPYEVELTQNGGTSWQYVAIPNPPGGLTGQELMMLHNGNLITTGSNGGWYLLRARSTVWTPIPKTILPSGLQVIEQIGGELWWYQYAPASASAAARDVHHTREATL